MVAHLLSTRLHDGVHAFSELAGPENPLLTTKSTALRHVNPLDHPPGFYTYRQTQEQNLLFV